jgi:hypothetical protein
LLAISRARSKAAKNKPALGRAYLPGSKLHLLLVRLAGGRPRIAPVLSLQVAQSGAFWDFVAALLRFRYTIPTKNFSNLRSHLTVSLQLPNEYGSHLYFQINLHFPANSSALRDNITSMIDHADFSVVVKNRAPPPKPWRWEIYRAGRTSPIDHSEIFFASMTEANRAGKAALSLLLSECQD